MDRITVISIEGPMGCGKSTLLESLKERFKGDPEFIFVDECVRDMECWGEEELYHPLKVFYDDPVHEGFPVQLHVMESLKRIYENVKDRVLEMKRPLTLICDRYIDSPRVFIPAMRQSGYLTDFGAVKLMHYHYGNLRELEMPKPVGIFYLNTPIDECMRRIAKRNRLGEDKLVQNRSYMSNLQDSYLQLKKETPSWKESTCTDVEGLTDEAFDFIMSCNGLK